MTTWFVSRHKSAKQWMLSKGYTIDKMVDHLEINELKNGDVVFGTLPIPKAFEV